MYEGLWGFLQNGASMAPERPGDAALNFRVAHGLAPRVFLGGCFSVFAVDTVLLPLCAGARPRQCRQGGGYCCHGEGQVASSQLPPVTELESFIIQGNVFSLSSCGRTRLDFHILGQENIFFFQSLLKLWYNSAWKLSCNYFFLNATIEADGNFNVD